MLKYSEQSDVNEMLKQVQHDVNNFQKLTYLQNMIRPLTFSRKGRGKCASPFTKNLAAFTLAEGATHIDTSNNVRRAAFTLAEVLITLGIIGVVAALTLPSLIANYQKSQFEAGVKKMSSVVGQAVTKLMADEGVNKITETSLLYNSTDDWQKGIDLGGEFLDKYFNVVEECTELEQCFGTDYKPALKNSADGYDPPLGGYFSDYSCKILADGVSICVRAGDESRPANVYFDLNGKRSPNRQGYDIFTFNLYFDGSVSEVDPKYRVNPDDNSCDNSVAGRVNICKDGGPSAGYGAGCFTYLQQNGYKIDY